VTNVGFAIRFRVPNARKAPALSGAVMSMMSGKDGTTAMTTD